MKLRIKLSLIVSGLTAIVVAILSAITLSQSSKLQTQAAIDNLTSIAGKTAVDIQRRYEQYVYAVQAVGQIMGTFEMISEPERRSRYDDMLMGLLLSNPHYMGIYTVWRPNTIDELDQNYITNENPTGQYVSMYVRTEGSLSAQMYPNYQQALANLTTNDIIGDPFQEPVKGKPTWLISISVPIIDNEDSRVVGFVGIYVDMSVLNPVADAGNRPFDQEGRLAIYANNGTIMAHETASLVGSKFQQSARDFLGAGGISAVEGSLKSGDSAVVGYNGQEVVSFPFKVGNSTTYLAAIASVPIKVVLRQVTVLTQFTIVLAVIAISISAVISFFVATSIVKPIINVSAMLKDISEGEGDLTKRIKLSSKDEIGDMAHYFNLTIDKIRALIITIKQQSVSLFDIGTELSTNMNQTAAAMNQISANIQSINGQVSNQSASVMETNSTMQQITSNIEKLNDHIENQSSNISQSSTAIEEIIANIASVTQTLVHNVENVKHLASASELGHTSLQEVSTDIQEIAKESEGLLEITAVMENIASQTNLLSMNAAIEAAHAGESGKGFAVVADEIRKLAESSGEQSKTIAVVLKKIKTSIDKIMKSTDAVLNRFEAIDSGVKVVSEQEERIRNAMEEQQTGGQQVLDVIARLNDITHHVRNGSADMLAGSKKIIGESRTLGSLTDEVSKGVQEMSNGADQVNVAVDRVSSLSNENKQHIDTLVREISRFKVE
ncbi:MAG: methyl-accepting chemotaxis protein [Treponema sp.]|jgi:methyl-accepting chemotaxis protein|nr:methyl-accepting chemotaxis protein [Treponema sp.]